MSFPPSSWSHFYWPWLLEAAHRLDQLISSFSEKKEKQEEIHQSAQRWFRMQAILLPCQSCSQHFLDSLQKGLLQKGHYFDSLVELRKNIALREGRPVRSPEYCRAQLFDPQRPKIWLEQAWNAITILSFSCPQEIPDALQASLDWFLRFTPQIFPSASVNHWVKILDEQGKTALVNKEQFMQLIHRLRVEAQTQPSLATPSLQTLVEQWVALLTQIVRQHNHPVASSSSSSLENPAKSGVEMFLPDPKKSSDPDSTQILLVNNKTNTLERGEMPTQNPPVPNTATAPVAPPPAVRVGIHRPKSLEEVEREKRELRARKNQEREKLRGEQQLKEREKRFEAAQKRAEPKKPLISEEPIKIPMPSSHISTMARSSTDKKIAHHPKGDGSQITDPSKIATSVRRRRREPPNLSPPPLSQEKRLHRQPVSLSSVATKTVAHVRSTAFHNGVKESSDGVKQSSDAPKQSSDARAVEVIVLHHRKIVLGTVAPPPPPLVAGLRNLKTHLKINTNVGKEEIARAPSIPQFRSAAIQPHKASAPLPTSEAVPKSGRLMPIQNPDMDTKHTLQPILNTQRITVETLSSVVDGGTSKVDSQVDVVDAVRASIPTPDLSVRLSSLAPIPEEKKISVEQTQQPRLSAMTTRAFLTRENPVFQRIASTARRQEITRPMSFTSLPRSVTSLPGSQNNRFSTRENNLQSARQRASSSVTTTARTSSSSESSSYQKKKSFNWAAFYTLIGIAFLVLIIFCAALYQSLKKQDVPLSPSKIESLVTRNVSFRDADPQLLAVVASYSSPELNEAAGQKPASAPSSSSSSAPPPVASPSNPR